MPERLVFTGAAWDDYCWWQGQDRKNPAPISHHPPTAAADPSAVARAAPSNGLDVVSTTPAPVLSPRRAPQRRLGTLATECGERWGLVRINKLILAAKREPFAGIGKPEPLRENLSGFWSRRIDDTHRLVYTVDDGDLVIIACRYHYEP